MYPTVRPPENPDRRIHQDPAYKYTFPVAEPRQTLIERGREAYERHRWREAYDLLTDADRDPPLDATDLERRGMAAYLAGFDAESTELLVRGHQMCLREGNLPRAARCAFYLASSLLSKGEAAPAGGWLARARRILDEVPDDCVERGYVLVPEAMRRIGEGDLSSAETLLAQAVAIGERFAEPDLINLARQGRGRTLIRMGDVGRGVAMLDEVMVAVTSGELSPIIAGIVYCSVISACLEMFDLRRAHEWTEALSHWCAAQPDLVPYRGVCMVHRAEIMQMRGVWIDAMHQAQEAHARLSAASSAASGAALYQLAELHRLRGDHARAEDTYRLTSESGHTPQPGLARLRLAQGRLDAAKASICRMVDEARAPRLRTAVLAAFVDIQLACGDTDAARRATTELSALAATLDTPVLRAMAAYAHGALALAAGDAKTAMASLRDAWKVWTDLTVPYEAARARVLIACACATLGDVDSAQLEREAARRVFEELGAAPDLAHLETLAPSPTPAPGSGLTSRELQVLQLVASGKTNRAIAEALAISEKTVARHISNIFTKLDLASRAAATAYAFQHRLV
jgi:ATP/maltotriose-dependent transcriptional regulator MalT